jgi:microsomal dipeptidase-like Zn-dependent dipeptidase
LNFSGNLLANNSRLERIDMTKTDLQSRREFLQTAPIVAALPSVINAKTKSTNKAAIPYVDGLSFFSQTPADVAASGLTAFILDTSSGEAVKREDGTTSFRRTFTACWRATVETRKFLRGRKDMFLATRGSQIKEAFKDKKTAIFLQFQGCDCIDEDLSRIDLFYEIGLRVLQITHHYANSFGGGALDKTISGLTKLGVEGVERMNALGIIPDLSHASDQTGLDVLKASKKPVIISHTGARSLVKNARCTSDEVIRGVAQSGGVTGIFMMSFWLTEDAVPTVDSLIKQIRHMINVGGIDSVGIANDYSIAGELSLVKVNNNNAEGVKGYWPWWESQTKNGILGFDRKPQHVVIPELNNVRRMFTIHEALEKNAFKPSEIEKIMGGNWIRVLTDSLG